MYQDNHLIHYTNIEALVSILKNRTIRFNSLDKMDDLQEKEVADLKNIGQFCYVSSWTDEEAESISMWKMYTDMNMGVRISLRKNPFMIYENRASDLEKVIKAPVKDESNGKPLKSLIPLVDMFSKKFICVEALNGNILHKVQYTDDNEKLNPKIVTKRGEGVSINLGILGKYKNLHWEFQHEWRYILLALPLSLNQPVEKSIIDSQMMVSRILKGVEKQPFPYYDLKITDEAFADMKITMSPNVSEGFCTIIKDLIEKYNPSATLEHSSLVGLI